MKKFDVVLIFVACVLVAILLGFSSFSVETETAGGGGSGFFSTFIKIALSFFCFFTSWVGNWRSTGTKCTLGFRSCWTTIRL